MTEPEPALRELLRVVNSRHETAFSLRGRYRGGENHGTYAITDADGSQLVLKRQRAAPGVLSRLERAADITRCLQTLGYPVPLYLLIGTTPAGELYHIQEALPGQPVDHLTEPHQVRRVLELNDLQAGQAVSSEQNWSTYVTRVVFEDASGWSALLRAYAPETAHLVQALETLTSGKDERGRTSGDVVHGDLSPGNILVHRGQISGIVDWDAAGCGDRAFDLALLLFYHYDDRRIREPLRERVLDLSGFDVLCVYLAHAALGQTAWSICHQGRAAVDHWLRLAGLVLDDLGSPTPFR